MEKLNYNKKWIGRENFEDVESVIFSLLALTIIGMALYGVAEMSGMVN